MKVRNMIRYHNLPDNNESLQTSYLNTLGNRDKKAYPHYTGALEEMIQT